MTTFNGLASFAAAFNLAQQKGTTIQEAAQEAQQEAKTTRKVEKQEQARRKAAKAKKSSIQRRRAWAARVQGEACIACGGKHSERVRASILFRLVNGNTGTINASICHHHGKGDSWRGVGSIVQVTPEVLPTANVESLEQEVQQEYVALSNIPQYLRETYAVIKVRHQTTKSIALATGKSISTVRKHVKALVDLGAVVRNGHILNVSRTTVKVSG